MATGVDEAGRGPVMGPLVVGAVWARDPDALAALGVDDSKRLSPARRVELDRRVRDAAAVVTVSRSAADIDRWREKRTLNELEVDMFAEALLVLGAGAGAGFAGEPVYLDAADVDEGRFGERVAARLRELGGPAVRAVARHRADSTYPEVGAASIAAKVARDAAMERIGAEAGVPVGSGYPSDPVTREYMAARVRETGELPPHVRRSWDTARDILRENTGRTPTLEEFGR